MESQTTSKTILIVGGGTGIGFEATKSILKIAGQDPARDTKVMIFGLQLDEDVEVLAQTYPQRVRYLQGDVTVPEERERGLQMCLSMMGGIDTLIYCAAVMTPIERIEKVDVDAVRRTFDVNVFGAMAMCQRALPYLRRRAESKIIILTSTCDLEHIYNGWVAYCASKAALSQFVRLLAREEPTVRVQGVYPRLTDTRLGERVYAGEYKGIMADDEIKTFQDWQRQGDVLEPPSWCGEAVAKLALDLVQGGQSGELLDYNVHLQRG